MERYHPQATSVLLDWRMGWPSPIGSYATATVFLTVCDQLILLGYTEMAFILDKLAIAGT